MAKESLNCFYRPVFFGHRDVCYDLLKLLLLQNEMHCDDSQGLMALTKIN